MLERLILQVSVPHPMSLRDLPGVSLVFLVSAKKVEPAAKTEAKVDVISDAREARQIDASIVSVISSTAKRNAKTTLELLPYLFMMAPS